MIESPISLSKRSFRCSHMQNVARMRKPAIKAKERIRLAAAAHVAMTLAEDDELLKLAESMIIKKKVRAPKPKRCVQ